MKLDIGLLRDSLTRLHEVQGVAFTKMMAKSGVYNVGRIVSKQITPRQDTWWRLHDAFPDDIPQPVYEDGTKIKFRPEAETGSEAAESKWVPRSPKKYWKDGEEYTEEQFYYLQREETDKAVPLDKIKHPIHVALLTTDELHYLKLLREVDKDRALLSKHLMELLEKRLTTSNNSI